MRILINGLSARAFSGWYVLRGICAQLATRLTDQHKAFLLIDRGQVDQLGPLPPEINLHILEEDLSHWLSRWRWEKKYLSAQCNSHGIDAILNFSGTLAPIDGVKQYCLGLNPWCMAPEIPKAAPERLKAFVQRHAYRQAFRKAEHFFFCSDHLRSLYRANNRGGKESPSTLALIGLNEDFVQQAAIRRNSTPKIPNLLLSVSVMAPWKGAERLVRLLSEVRRSIPMAQLRLVGPWPIPQYRKEVETLIAKLGLVDAVQITGRVSNDELSQHYAEAMVFALLSRAESFGIPAVEAQAFGVPVIGATGCAMPEIGGEGGFYVNPEDYVAAAKQVTQWFTNQPDWQEASARAETNAKRFAWSSCLSPMLDVILGAKTAHGETNSNRVTFR